MFSMETTLTVTFLLWLALRTMRMFAGAWNDAAPEVKGEAKKVAGGLLLKMLKSRM